MNQMISLLRRGATPTLRRPRGAMLNVEQKKVAKDITAQFDAEKSSPEMRQEMQRAFDAAKIRPGDDLKQILEEAGFRPDPKDLPATDQSMARHKQTMPRDLGRPADLPSFVTTYLAKEKAGAASDTDTRSFLQTARQMSPPPKGIFVNILA